MDAVRIAAMLILATVPYYAVVLVLLAVGKWFFDLSYRQFRLDHQMVKQDNPALALIFAGYLLGLTVALLAQLSSIDVDWRENLILLGGEGLLVLLLLRVALFIQDHVILHRFSLIKELIERRNIAVGVVSACGLVANGLILSGAMVGESAGPVSILLDVVVYWGVGQVILILAALFYQWLTPYNFHHLIGKEKNVAAGLAMGGFTLAAGFITRMAVWDSGSALVDEFITTLLIAGGGFVLLALSRWLVDIVFLPMEKIKDEIILDRNPAVGLVLGSFYVVSALAFSSTLRAMLGGAG